MGVSRCAFCHRPYTCANTLCALQGPILPTVHDVPNFTDGGFRGQFPVHDPFLNWAKSPLTQMHKAHRKFLRTCTSTGRDFTKKAPSVPGTMRLCSQKSGLLRNRDRRDIRKDQKIPREFIRGFIR